MKGLDVAVLPGEEGGVFGGGMFCGSEAVNNK